LLDQERIGNMGGGLECFVVTGLDFDFAVLDESAVQFLIHQDLNLFLTVVLFGKAGCAQKQQASSKPGEAFE
jgi:hypothetical protein